MCRVAAREKLVGVVVMDIPASSFLVALEQENNLDVKSWIFDAGMGFGARLQWWGKGCCRPHPHEGVDFRVFEDGTGRRCFLDAGTRVVAMYDGVVTSVFDDFLGKTILLAHDIFAAGARLYSLYSHCRPVPFSTGCRVSGGDVLGALSTCRGNKIGPHLHLSLVWLDEPLAAAVVSWPQIIGAPTVRFIDPLSHMMAKKKLS